jgi:hypothetical protein
VLLRGGFDNLFADPEPIQTQRIAVDWDVAAGAEQVHSDAHLFARHKDALAQVLATDR